MKMTVKKTSVFTAKQSNVFALLQRFDTLSYIANTYATFNSLDGQPELTWEVGRSFSFDFKIFGFIPLGVHVINVKEFNPDNIYTNESNPFWNIVDLIVVDWLLICLLSCKSFVLPKTEDCK